MTDGIRDGEADAEQPESYYRDLLAEQTGGKIEFRLPFGRADVLTDTHIFEVEPVGRWRHGAAQALQYGSQVSQKGALALYGHATGLAGIFTDLGRLPEPGLELWWFADDKFVALESAADVSRYAPARRIAPVAAPAAADLAPVAGRLGLVDGIVGIIEGMSRNLSHLIAVHMATIDHLNDLERRVAALTGEAPRTAAEIAGPATAAKMAKMAQEIGALTEAR